MRWLPVLLLLLHAPAEARPPTLDFELYDLQSDRLVRTATLRRSSRLVLVDFFSQSCKPCRKSLPAWRKLHRSHARSGLALVIVAVPDDMTDREAALGRLQRLFRHEPVPFDVVWDKYLLVARRYGVLHERSLRLPRAFLLDGQGKLLLQDARPEPIIAQVRRRLAQ